MGEGEALFGEFQSLKQKTKKSLDLHVREGGLMSSYPLKEGTMHFEIMHGYFLFWVGFLFSLYLAHSFAVTFFSHENIHQKYFLR